MATEQINRQYHIPPAYRAPEHKNAFLRGLSRFGSLVGNFLLKHWATCLAALLGIVVFLALSVPFLFYLGLDAVARQIYFSLHLICAQIPSHSFYIFGHPLGLCERNFSIYASMFVGTLIFVLSKKRLPGLPWWLWILAMLPMAADGFTQLFGLRESTPELRIITGVLFGLGNVWFVLPLIQRNIALEPHSVAAYYPPAMHYVQQPLPAPSASIQSQEQPAAPTNTPVVVAAPAQKQPGEVKPNEQAEKS